VYYSSPFCNITAATASHGASANKVSLTAHEQMHFPRIQFLTGTINSFLGYQGIRIGMDSFGVSVVTCSALQDN